MQTNNAFVRLAEGVFSAQVQEMRDRMVDKIKPYTDTYRTKVSVR